MHVQINTTAISKKKQTNNFLQISNLISVDRVVLTVHTNSNMYLITGIIRFDGGTDYITAQ